MECNALDTNNLITVSSNRTAQFKFCCPIIFYILPWRKVHAVEISTNCFTVLIKCSNTRLKATTKGVSHTRDIHKLHCDSSSSRNVTLDADEMLV